MTILLGMVCVADKARAEGFYADVLGPVLGLGLVEPDAYGVQFTGATAQVRLTLIPDWQPGPHPVLGWVVADIGATVAALAARGLAMQHYPCMGMDERGIVATEAGNHLAWFNDSEGNVLMLAQRP